MFDLFRSQAKAMRYLLIVLLSLVALSMVVTLIPGFGSSTNTAGDQIVAEVGDNTITMRQIQQIIQFQTRDRAFPKELADVLIPQMVTQYVGEVATIYQAQQMGFKVSDQELIKGIQATAPQLFQNGQFVGTDVYEQYLSQMNMTIPEFEMNVRRSLLLNKLQAIAYEGIVITNAEVEREYQKRSEKVKLAVVRFDVADFRKEIKPTRQELEDYLKANPAGFMTPAKQNLDLIVIDEKKLGESIPVTDAQLRRTYETNQDHYSVEENVHVRHILCKFDSAAPDAADQKAKAKAKCEGLMKQIKGGADFAELAKKNSDDPGSASKGGDYENVKRNVMVKQFEDAAFTQKPKELGLIETQYGFHIVQVLERQNARIKPFEEVKAELATDFRRSQLFDKMPALAEQVHAELQKTPTQGEQIAKRLNLSFLKVQGHSAGAPYPEIGPANEIDSVVVGLAKGGVSPVVQLPENRLAVAVVTDVTLPVAAPLSEVEDRVRTALVEVKAGKMAEDRAKEFEAKLKANHNDLRKTAQEMNVKVIETNEVERTGQMEGIGPATYFGEQPFINPVGQTVSYHVANTPYFFQILSRSPGDPAKLAEMRESILTTLRDAKTRERRELFEEGLVRTLTQKGKIKIHDAVVKRLIANYRGA